jgi:hypothetical protein
MRRLVLLQTTQFPATEAGPTFAAEGLRGEMRRLWADRVALITRFHAAMNHGGNDTTGIAERLLRNQDAIGNAMKPFYGEEVGDRLSFLLRDQFLVGAGLVRAARTGDAAGQQRATRRWQANADELSAFLASENPHWSGETLEGLHSHLAMTTDAVVVKPRHDTAEGDFACERRQEQMLQVADSLCAGIVEQFPARFGP